MPKACRSRYSKTALSSSAYAASCTPSIARKHSRGNESTGNTLPRAGVIRISGSNDRYMLLISPSKPLNTDSRITIAITGIATEKALTPEMILITECDFFEKR